MNEERSCLITSHCLHFMTCVVKNVAFLRALDVYKPAARGADRVENRESGLRMYVFLCLGFQS